MQEKKRPAWGAGLGKGGNLGNESAYLFFLAFFFAAISILLLCDRRGPHYILGQRLLFPQYVVSPDPFVKQNVRALAIFPRARFSFLGGDSGHQFAFSTGGAATRRFGFSVDRLFHISPRFDRRRFLLLS